MKATIKKFSYALGEKRVENSDLSQVFPDLNIKRLEKKVGIKTRYRSTVSTLENAISSVEKLELTPGEITNTELIIYCTQHESSNIPNDSFLIHKHFGFHESTETIYTNLGCSAYPTLLNYAFALKRNKTANILIITSEKYSQSISTTDPINNYLFSDIATSLYLEIEGDLPKYTSGTMSSALNHLCIPNKVNSPNKNLSPHFYMDGQAVYSFSQNAVEKLNHILNINEDMIVIPHQANEYMIQSMKNKINSENIIINFHDFGNSVSSTIPMAIITMIKNGTYRNGVYALLGFGVGLAYSGIIINLYYDGV